MDAREFAGQLEDLVRYDIPKEASLYGLIERVLAGNAGFVVRMMDGAAFQITVMQSRPQRGR